MLSDSPVPNKNPLKKSVFYSFLSPYIRENRILMYFLEDRGLSDPVDDRVRNWTFNITRAQIQCCPLLPGLSHGPHQSGWDDIT